VPGRESTARPHPSSSPSSRARATAWLRVEVPSFRYSEACCDLTVCTDTNSSSAISIYGITAFAGFEAAAALGEEARDTRRSVPASIIGIVVVTGIFYLLIILAETFGAGRRGIGGFIAQPSPLGYLTSRYWSPSALWVIDLVVVITGLGFVIAASNAAIRVVFAMAREQALPGSLTRLSGRRTPSSQSGVWR